MKKATVTAILAMLTTTPAFAWHPIVIYNNTDPVVIKSVTFTAPGFNPVTFEVDVPIHSFRTFGPVPDQPGSPCLRHLVVDLILPAGVTPYAAPTPMDVCNEGWINVSFAHVYPGGDTVVITHGVGSGPAGPPSGTGSGVSGGGHH